MHLLESQKKMKAHYDKKAEVSFQPGETVLVFIAMPGNPLGANLFGPYEVERKSSDVDCNEPLVGGSLPRCAI